MKIGLVVFPFVPSHGSLLQTYALYTKLIEMGHDVIIINRKRPILNKRALLRRTCSHLLGRIKGSYYGPVFYKGNSPKAIMKNLQPFIDTYFGHNIITTYSKEETEQIINGRQFDAFIVGSDQVWRPKYVPDVYHYYLDFLPKELNAKRIAFCPSFGTSDWEYNDEQTEKCRNLLSLFDAVAVRENSGVELCHKYFNKSVNHLLDPTILLLQSEYKKLIVQNESDKRSDTFANRIIGVYFLDDSVEKQAIVNAVANGIHLFPVYINNKIQDYNARISERIAPSIAEWLNGFIQSDFVITDSFHATIFAIYFNKPFITVINENRGAARFQSLLGEMGLNSRMVLSSKDITDRIINERIKWDTVNNYLDEQRNRSIAFLNRSLNEL